MTSAKCLSVAILFTTQVRVYIRSKLQFQIITASNRNQVTTSVHPSLTTNLPNMKPSVLAGLVLALAVSSSAIPADSNPFGIKQGWGSGWGWAWSPPPPVTDAPVTVAPVTDAPTTVAPVTDAPTTLAPVIDAPVTLPPGTTACIPVTGSTDGCDDTLMSLINWLVPYLINAISTLLTKQGRIPSVFLITKILVQFIICLINALIGAQYPVLDALLAILASRS